MPADRPRRLPATLPLSEDQRQANRRLLEVDVPASDDDGILRADIVALEKAVRNRASRQRELEAELTQQISDHAQALDRLTHQNQAQLTQQDQAYQRDREAWLQRLNQAESQLQERADQLARTSQQAERAQQELLAVQVERTAEQRDSTELLAQSEQRQEQLSQHLEEARASNADRESQIEQITDESRHIQADFQVLIREMESKASSREHQVRRQLDDATDRIADHAKTIADLRNRLKNCESRYAQSSSQHERAQELRRDTVRQLVVSDNALRDLSADLVDASRLASEQRTKNHRLERHAESLVQRCEVLVASRAHLQSTSERHKHVNDKLQQAYQDLIAQHTSLQNSHDELLASSDALIDERKYLRQQLVNQKSEHDAQLHKLRQQIAACQSKLDHQRQQILAEVSRLKEDARVAHELEQDLRASVASLSEVNHGLREAVGDAKRQSDQFRADRDDAIEKLASAESRLQAADHQSKSQLEQIDALQQRLIRQDAAAELAKSNAVKADAEKADAEKADALKAEAVKAAAAKAIDEELQKTKRQLMRMNVRFESARQQLLLSQRQLSEFSGRNNADAQDHAIAQRDRTIAKLEQDTRELRERLQREAAQCRKAMGTLKRQAQDDSVQLGADAQQAWSKMKAEDQIERLQRQLVAFRKLALVERRRYAAEIARYKQQLALRSDGASDQAA